MMIGRWIRKGLKDAFQFSSGRLLRYSLVVVLMILVSLEVSRTPGAPTISVVDLYTLVFGDFLYRTWVLPVTAALYAISLHLSIRRSRILYYQKRQNAWMELAGQMIAEGISYSILLLVSVLAVGIIVSNGTFVNEEDPYSLVQILLHGVSADPMILIGRAVAATFIQMFFIGMLAAGVSWLTGKEYIGVIAAVCCIFIDSRVGLFPYVNTSYYYFITPDHTLLYGLIKTVAIWGIFMIINRRRKWEVL